MPSGISRQDSRRWTAVVTVWLVVCAAAVCVATLEVFSVEGWRSSVEIENATVALVIGQTFFLVVIWPLFEHRARGARVLADAAGAAGRLAGMLVLTTPLLLLTLRTSEVGAGAVIRSQVLLLVIGIAVWAALRLPGATAWYYPAAFVLSAVVSFAAYLLREEGGLSPTWATPISPFWAAGAVVSGAAFLPPLIVFASLGVAAVAARLLLGLRAEPAPRPDHA